MLLVPSAWARSALPVVAGSAPPGTCTLAALGDADVAVALAARAAARGEPARAAALAPLHLARVAVVELLVAPAVLDGVALEASADGLGIVLDAGDAPVLLWAGHARRVAAQEPAAHVGALAARLLGPIGETARATCGLGRRGVANVWRDGLLGAAEQLERDGGRAGSAEALLAAAAPDGHRPGRLLQVEPDAGPPVALRVPRTCCVLAREAGPHACPTCPQHADDATRRRLAEAWLQELDGSGFRRVAGRRRVRARGFTLPGDDRRAATGASWSP